LEAAEAAKTFNGAVYIDQSVLLITDVEDGMPDEDGCVPLDEGFSVMVADFMPADSRARFDAQANRDA
jgi:hypothetical protein